MTHQTKGFSEMSEIPKIVIYSSNDAPANATHVGFFSLQSGNLPMVFSGSSEAMVRKAAEDWWTAETMKVDRRKKKED